MNKKTVSFFKKYYPFMVYLVSEILLYTLHFNKLISSDFFNMFDDLAFILACSLQAWEFYRQKMYGETKGFLFFAAISLLIMLLHTFVY